MRKRRITGYHRYLDKLIFEMDIPGVARGEGVVPLTHENAEKIAGQKLDVKLDYFLEDYD